MPANEDEFSGPTRGGMVSWQVGGNDSEVSWCNSSYFLGHEDLFLHEMVVLCKNHQFFFFYSFSGLAGQHFIQGFGFKAVVKMEVVLV